MNLNKGKKLVNYFKIRWIINGLSFPIENFKIFNKYSQLSTFVSTLVITIVNSIIAFEARPFFCLDSFLSSSYNAKLKHLLILCIRTLSSEELTISSILNSK